MATGPARKYPRSAVRVSAGDVGRRVTVRRELPSGDFTDVLGRLLSHDGAELVVLRRTGETVILPLADVAAARVVGR